MSKCRKFTAEYLQLYHKNI